MGPGGFVGFERGAMGGAGSLAGVDGVAPLPGPGATGNAGGGSSGTEAEFRRIMRSRDLSTMFTGLSGMVNR